MTHLVSFVTSEEIVPIKVHCTPIGSPGPLKGYLEELTSGVSHGKTTLHWRVQRAELANSVRYTVSIRSDKSKTKDRWNATGYRFLWYVSPDHPDSLSNWKVQVASD